MNPFGFLRRLLPDSAKPVGPAIKGTPAGRAPSISEQRAEKFYEHLDRRQSPSRYERIRNRSADIAGRAWFLPYLDSITGETDAMRAAYKKMLASPYIKSALLYKVSAVAALDWQIQAADPTSPRDREACEFLRFSIDRTPEGMPGIIQAVLAPMLIDGYGVSEKVVEVERDEQRWRGKVTLAAVKSKSTSLYDLEVDAFNNVQGIRGKGTNAGECWPIRDFIYNRHLAVYDEPRGMSDFRAAYGDYWMHDTVSKLRAIHAEKKTSPFLLGEYEEDDDKSSLEVALAMAKTSTWMAVPAGVRIQALNLAGQGEGDFKSFCDDKQKGMLIAILGAYLQVLEGQVPDGRGNALVSKGITELLIWLLASLAQRSITRQVFPDLIAWNYAGVGIPSLVLGGVSEQEVQAIIANVSGAQQAGAKPSASDFYRRTGIQMASGPEDELKPLQPQAPALGGGLGGMGGGGLPFSDSADDYTPFWEAFAAADVSWEPYTHPQTGQSGARSSGGRVLYGQAAIEVLRRVGSAAAKGAKAGAKVAVKGAKAAGRAVAGGARTLATAATTIKDYVSRPLLKPKELDKVKAAAIAGGLHPEQAAKLDSLSAPRIKAALADANKIANPQARQQAVAAAVRGGLTPDKVSKVVAAAKAGGLKGRALTRLERAVDPKYREKIAQDAAEKVKELSLATKWHAENKQKFGPTAANVMYAAHWAGRLVARPVIAVATGGLSLIPGVSLTSRILTGQIVRKTIRAIANVVKYGVVKPLRVVARQSEGADADDGDIGLFADASGDMIASLHDQWAADGAGDAPDWSDEQLREILATVSQLGLTEEDMQEFDAIDPDSLELAALLDEIAGGAADEAMLERVAELAALTPADDIEKLLDGFVASANPDDASTAEVIDTLGSELDGADESSGTSSTSDNGNPAPGVAGVAPFRGEQPHAGHSEPDRWDWGLTLAIE